MNQQETDNRLRWKCRRGMLELDIMLQCFLDNVDNGYASLDSANIKIFEQLLSYEDNPLFELLMGNMQAANPEMNYVIKSIQQATRSNN